MNNNNNNINNNNNNSINNNICCAVIPLPNTFLDCSLTKDGEGKFVGKVVGICFLFYFNFICFEFFYNLHLNRETRGSSPGCVRRRSMVINTLCDDSLIRMRAIIPFLVE